MIRGDMNRRGFARLLGVGGAAWPLFPDVSTRVIGHTGITWGNDAEQAVRDLSSLGYCGFETFAATLESWEPRGGLRKILDEHTLPLISGYCTVNLTDSTKREEELRKLARAGGLIARNGGTIAVLGPNGVTRSGFDFASHKANIVAMLNECGNILQGMGLTAVLHQHTGTAIETRDEVYAVLDAVDTRCVQFGPDIGQLQKGGADPVQVVKDYLPLIRHMHLKDYSGGEHFLRYCPLGQGRVDIPAVLNLAANANMKGMVMVELDPSPNMPATPADTARIGKFYLERLGYTFKTQEEQP
jgi:inosose dehydratase